MFNQADSCTEDALEARGYWQGLGFDDVGLGRWLVSCRSFGLGGDDLVATPSQLHLPQYGVDAEDSGPLQDFRVRDHVLPSQLQYSAEAVEMEVIQLPGLVRVDGPGFRSVQDCYQGNGLEHLQFGIQVKIVVIPYGGLQHAEGLTSFGDPLSNLVVDSRVA
ncbi:unnamed protein product [Schistocephalus solidus]|uniref:Uncharacterized protein n=1 Tax=Schistocephalus solidus TaxID=70667 RepID=A0A183TBM7_SCHSO|nr:unnamed protein product [Schistocephalus solidus]